MNTSEKVKIFISWSGHVSNAVAKSLHAWLPKVLPSVDPWVSNISIDKGSSWVNALLNQLERSSIGIICLTPDNLGAPFIHFETGALLAKKADESRVCTYLYNLNPSEVRPPLSLFQHTKFEKNDTLQLLQTVNRTLGDKEIPDDHLKTYFNRQWQSFERRVHKAVDEAERIATPRQPNSSQPVKWIHVAGSGNINNPPPKEVSRLVGRALAQHDFGILTAGWPLVDQEVTEAYSSERERLNRPAFIKQVIRGDHDQLFKAGIPIWTHSAHTVWAEQARESDACVLIAGEGGTLQTGLWMASIGKPVFPLAKTGGDAEKYFYACKEDVFHFNEKIPGVSKYDFERLNDSIPEVIDTLTELLNKWAQQAS